MTIREFLVFIWTLLFGVFETLYFNLTKTSNTSKNVSLVSGLILYFLVSILILKFFKKSHNK